MTLQQFILSAVIDKQIHVQTIFRSQCCQHSSWIQSNKHCLQAKSAKGSFASVHNSRSFKLFPHNEVLEFDPEYNAISGFELFCSCRMPDDGFIFECSECKKWFHAQHQNVVEDELSKQVVKCFSCKVKTKIKETQTKINSTKISFHLGP